MRRQIRSNRYRKGAIPGRNRVLRQPNMLSDDTLWSNRRLADVQEVTPTTVRSNGFTWDPLVFQFPPQLAMLVGWIGGDHMAYVTTLDATEQRPDEFTIDLGAPMGFAAPRKPTWNPNNGLFEWNIVRGFSPNQTYEMAEINGPAPYDAQGYITVLDAGAQDACYHPDTGVLYAIEYVDGSPGYYYLTTYDWTTGAKIARGPQIGVNNGLLAAGSKTPDDISFDPVTGDLYMIYRTDHDTTQKYWAAKVDQTTGATTGDFRTDQVPGTAFQGRSLCMGPDGTGWMGHGFGLEGAEHTLLEWDMTTATTLRSITFYAPGDNINTPKAAFPLT